MTRSILMILGWLLVIKLLCPGSLVATTYYIHYGAGSNSANGTTTDTPWQHCPGDPNAYGNPASATLNPGDFLVFRGGVTYEGQIDCNWSGSQGDPITFISGSSLVSAWGSGTATIDGTDTLDYLFRIDGNWDWITLHGLRFYRTDNHGHLAGMVTDENDGSRNDGIVIFGCTFLDSEVRGIWFDEVSGMTIMQCFFNKVHSNNLNNNHRVINIRDGSDLFIMNNHWYDNGTGVFLNECTEVVVISGNIFDLAGITAHRGHCGKASSSGISEYNNWYREATQHSTWTYGNQGGTQGWFWNNVLVGNNIEDNLGHMLRLRSSGSPRTKVEAYNNSWTDDDGNSRMIQVSGGSQLILKNCVFHGILTNIIGIDSTSSPYYEGDYNRFYDTSAANTFDWNGDAIDTLAEWKLTTGQDANSTWGDPLYTNRANDDLTLQATSPCIDAGTDLSQFFGNDYVGTSRPQGAKWDQGAYEDMESAPPEAPTGRGESILNALGRATSTPTDKAGAFIGP